MPVRKIEVLVDDSVVDFADQLNGMRIGMINFCPQHKVAICLLLPAEERNVDGLCLMRALQELQNDVVSGVPTEVVVVPNKGAQLEN